MRGSFIALRRRFNQKPLFQSPLRSATAIHQTSSSSSFSPQWVVPLCCCEIDPICRLQRSPWCGISTRLEVLIILRAHVWHYALWIQQCLRRYGWPPSHHKRRHGWILRDVYTQQHLSFLKKKQQKTRFFKSCLEHPTSCVGQWDLRSPGLSTITSWDETPNRRLLCAPLSWEPLAPERPLILGIWHAGWIGDFPKWRIP